MTTEGKTEAVNGERKPREWWLLIRGDGIIIACGLKGYLENISTGDDTIVHVREVLEDSDGKD